MLASTSFSYFMAENPDTNLPLAVQRSESKTPLGQLARITVSFGIITGLVEGCGLMLFQRVNWERWGPMIHVSWEIVWIAPVVDVALFAVAALVIWFMGRFSRVPTLQLVVFVLSFLAVYDWLTLTGRLYRLACVILGLGAAVAVTRRFSAKRFASLEWLAHSTVWIVAVFFSVLAAAQLGAMLKEQRAVASLPRPHPGSPNVIVLVVDTLRADHVSSYGYSRPTTPNLDRLASQGVRFANAIAPSSWSLPSHASLVTGTYLHDHKLGNVEPEPWTGWRKVSLGGLPTIGEALEKRGYRTGAFSANRTYFSHSLGFGRGFVHFEDYFNSPADCFVRTLYGREFARVYLKRSDKSLVKRILRTLGWTSLLDQDAEGSGSYGGAFGVRKHADEVNDELLHWIAVDQNRPFFAFLNYFDVHDPYGGPHSYPKPDWSQHSTIDSYDDGVRYADDTLGRLMDALRAQGLSDKTLVIVTSDHGESLGQHFLMTHGRALYWELIHVPLVFWYPGHVPSGVSEKQPVTNAAIAATIMDMVSGSEDGFPGPGLDQFWRMSPGTEAPSPLSELAQNKYPGQHDVRADALIPTATTGAMQSVVTDRWQLIRHQTKGAQLYEWQNDAEELHDLISAPEQQSTAEELQQKLVQRTGH